MLLGNSCLHVQLVMFVSEDCAVSSWRWKLLFFLPYDEFRGTRHVRLCAPISYYRERPRHTTRDQSHMLNIPYIILRIIMDYIIAYCTLSTCEGPNKRRDSQFQTQSKNGAQ